MKVFIIILLNLFILNCSLANESNDKSFEFFKGNKTKIKNPFDLRDPFKRKLKKTKSAKAKIDAMRNKGIYSNVPTIDGIKIDDIRIVGILIGKERRAIAKVDIGGEKLSKESYILKEGMFVGENKAEIKAILPGGVVLVEKIKNVYDQDEYLETILPVISNF